MVRKTVFACLGIFALWFFGVADRVYIWAAVPPGIGAWFVTYADNRTFGFGPGGNETGFNVVLLTSHGAVRVAQGGVRWLDARSGQKGWVQTPVPHVDAWMEDGSGRRFSAPTIDAILWRYGFGFDLPPVHKSAIDSALNAPGSFVGADGSGRLLVIVPATLRAYVVYAG